MNHLSVKTLITACSRLGNTGHIGFHKGNGRYPSRVVDEIRFQGWHHSVSSHPSAKAAADNALSIAVIIYYSFSWKFGMLFDPALKEVKVLTLSIRALIAALVIAIGIQNTCPHGWAAKSAFISYHVSHSSPMKEHKHSYPSSREDSGKESSHVHPAFVFHVSNPVTVPQTPASLHSDIPFVSDPILEVLSDPPLKPPTCYLFV